jgi:hypothetical protein
LLRIVLGNPERLEFLWEKQVAKSSGESREVVAVICLGSFFTTNFFNSVVGVVAAVRDTGDVAICVALASAVAAATSSPGSTV